MSHVLIIHEVAAYPAWKAVLDGAAGLRKQAGEISYQLLRRDTDANHVVHFSCWSTLGALLGVFSSHQRWSRFDTKRASRRRSSSI